MVMVRAIVQLVDASVFLQILELGGKRWRFLQANFCGLCMRSPAASVRAPGDPWCGGQFCPACLDASWLEPD